MGEKLLSIGETTKYLNVSRATIDRWQASGILHPLYTPGGHRRFRETDLRAAIGLEKEHISKNRTIIYARVPTPKQKGALQQQKERLLIHAAERGYQVIAVLTEIASGLDEHRPQLRKALQQISAGQVDILIVESRERLVRSGFEYLNLFITTCGGRVETLDEIKKPGARQPALNGR